MSDPQIRDIAREFYDDSDHYMVKALEAAYWRGHAARVLEPTEKEREALLNVLHYARDIEAKGSTDWEARHLASAVDSYDVAACTTPTGKRAHGSFIETIADVTRCSFCKVSVDCTSGGEE
jgi:hypothetical protein